MVLFICRGSTFRPVLLKLGELRSLMPENVNVMALTATATKHVRLELAKIIGMINPINVVLPPCKGNLFFEVSPYVSIQDNFMFMLEELRILRESFPRTIIYCRRMNDCSDIYQYF